MKKTLISALAAGALFAAMPAKAQDHSFTLDMTYTGLYVFRGAQLAEGSWQPSFEYASGDFYAGVWLSLPTESADTTTDETDFYFGYGIALSEAISLDIGVAEYTYSAGGDTTEPFIGIASEFVSLYVYEDLDLDTTTFELGAGSSADLGDGWSLDYGGYVGNADTDGAGDYTYYGADLNLSYGISDTASFAFGIHWADADNGDSNTWATIGISVSN